MKGPVFVASGCGGTGRELEAYGDLAVLGGFVTRTFTLDARAGGPSRLAESPAGLVRAHALQNPGIDRFLMSELPWLAQRAVPTWVSLVAGTLGEYADLARRAGGAPGVAGVELNLAIAEPRAWGFFNPAEAFQAARVVAAARAELPPGRSLHVKLVADPLRVGDLARAVADAGADAVVVGGALPAALDNGTSADLSGPAVRPVSVRCIAAARAATDAGGCDVRIIGVGGVSTTADARAALAAGADGIQVGSALLHDPTTAFGIARDLAEELQDIS